MFVAPAADIRSTERKEDSRAGWPGAAEVPNPSRGTVIFATVPAGHCHFPGLHCLDLPLLGPRNLPGEGPSGGFQPWMWRRAPWIPRRTVNRENGISSEATHTDVRTSGPCVGGDPAKAGERTASLSSAAPSVPAATPSMPAQHPHFGANTPIIGATPSPSVQNHPSIGANTQCRRQHPHYRR
jgi:hypothetical protein